MSHALIIDLFQAVDTSDWNSIAQIFHEEVIYERPGYETFKGLPKLLQFYQCERVIQRGTHYLDHIVIDGNYGACWGRFIGVKKDGSPVEELFADVYFLEDGKIRTRRSHFFKPAV
jgi:ketosteroid isomerase-like protein